MDYLKQWFQLYNTNPTAGSLWSDGFRILDCNDAMVKLLGISCKEDYINNFYKFVPEIQPSGISTAQLLEEINQNVREKGHYGTQWAYLSATGELIPGQASISRVTTDEGDIYAAYLIDTRQVDAAQQGEKAAIEMNIYTRMMLDYAPIAVTLFNSNKLLIDCNDASAQLFGFDDKSTFLEALSGNFIRYSPELQPCGMLSSEKFIKVFGKAIAEGRATFEWMHFTKTGEELPVEVTIVCIPYQNDFMLTAYIHDIRDVVEARQKEEDTNAFNQALIDASPYVIGLWDDAGNILMASEQGKDFFGVPDPKMIADNLYAYSPEFQPCGTPTPKKAEHYYQQAMRDGYARFEWLHKRTDGELMPCECIYKIYEHGGKKLLLSYTMDLRLVKKAMEDSHRMELAEASNKAKSQFLARMSHEIRTPISSVLGISEIQLQNPHLPPAIEEAFAKIHSSAGVLLSIINDILDLSRVEAGKMTILNERYELASMVSDILHIRHNHLEDRNFKFILQLDENLPAYLEGDAIRIGQIVNNLLSNAFKYTESGSVTLTIKHQTNETENDITLVIAVSDTGYGMSKEQVSSLQKNEYTRLHEYGHKFIAGTGLGLPIVFHMTQVMGAEIYFDSTIGVGTTVTVRIPQKRIGSEILGKNLAVDLQEFKGLVRAAEKRHKFSPESMPYGRVLVVDDIEANLYVAQGLLAFYGLQIETCTNGLDAVKKIKQGKVYDVIFMDHMMPGLNGVETLKIIRKMGYKEPIVALTANALIGKAEEFISSGFDGFIAKPIQTGHLNTILIKHIREKQPPEVIEAALLSQAEKHKIVSNIDNFQNSDVLLKKLRANFASKQKDAYFNIRQALDAGDIDTAHLLVHSVKGLAGLIHESALAEIAEKIELLLEEGKIPKDNELRVFETELQKVLKNIGTINVDKNEAISLLEELRELLKGRSAGSLDMLDKVKSIPETAVLARQIEKFDFGSALKTLDVLMELQSP